MTQIRLRVNGKPVADDVPPRLSLADFLRERRNLTGTHLGCEHGVCGACTILMEGEPVRACLMLAVQAEGRSIVTIEGLPATGGPDSNLAGADSNGTGARDGLHPIQQAFMDKHGLQCGFCTSGIVLTAEAFLRDTPSPSHQEIREMLAGNLCRCTGYQQITDAIEDAARQLREEKT